MRQHIRRMIDEARQREGDARSGHGSAFVDRLSRNVISTAHTAAALHLAARATQAEDRTRCSADGSNR